MSWLLAADDPKVPGKGNVRVCLHAVKAKEEPAVESGPVLKRGRGVTSHARKHVKIPCFREKNNVRQREGIGHLSVA